ncbi:MAG TPA: cupin domain-containing protein [Casimicrobiaceae bacterium]
MERPIVNLDELAYEPWDARFPPDDRPGERYGARRAPVSQRLGARKLGYNVTAILPGKRAFPRHNHRVNEEMFLILEGVGEVIVGESRWPVRKGDVIACPPGARDTAHQIVNTSADGDLVVLCVSTLETPDIVEYPDSGKVGYGGRFAGPDGKPDVMYGLCRDDAKVRYWEGEA